MFSLLTPSTAESQHRRAVRDHAVAHRDKTIHTRPRTCERDRAHRREHEAPGRSRRTQDDEVARESPQSTAPPAGAPCHRSARPCL